MIRYALPILCITVAHAQPPPGQNVADAATFGAVATLAPLCGLRDETWSDGVALTAAMQDKEWATRAAAVHVVAMHNDPSLLDKFVPLMDDKKEQVSFRAAAGYIRLYIIAHKSQAATGE